MAVKLSKRRIGTKIVKNQNKRNEMDQTSAVEVLRKLEDEHLRLQRQIRSIQADRKGAVGANPQHRKYLNQLKILRSEYIDLAKNLKIAKSGAHKKKDKRMSQDLTRALLEQIRVSSEAEAGERLMDEFEDLLQRNNRNMLGLKRRVNESIGILDFRKFHSASRVQHMENKLEVAMLRFNTIQCENKKIRKGIEHLLKDRVIFNQCWSKMIGSLSKGKTFLGDLFEQSNLAYDLRDDCCKKLRSLQEKGKVDQMIQMQEMRDLRKILDHDIRLHYFLAAKSVKRINARQERREIEQKIKEEETLLEKLNEIKAIIDGIHEYTNETNDSTIAKHFELRDVHNFSVYELLTHVCAENVALKRKMKMLKQNIVDRRDHIERRSAERNLKLEGMERELSERRSRNNDLNNRLIEKEKLLNSTMESVEELFRMVGCTYEPFQNLLGVKRPSLKLPNLTFSLMYEKIKDYIQCVYFTERTSPKKRTGATSSLKKYTIYVDIPKVFEPTSINLLVPADPCPQCIEARWLSRLTDKMELPFTEAEARRAIKVLASEPAYERSDRLHGLVDCRLPRSRMILAKRFMT